jgi:hypothetical protein
VVEMTDNTDSVIYEIMQNYPEYEWLERCHEALPGVDDAILVTAFEIFSGGDIEEIDG